MLEVIYEDNEFQITSFENGVRGNRFALCENGIDKEKGGQRELINITVDRLFLVVLKM